VQHRCYTKCNLLVITTFYSQYVKELVSINN
jgi:hypothetical protein